MLNPICPKNKSFPVITINNYTIFMCDKISFVLHQNTNTQVVFDNSREKIVFKTYSTLKWLKIAPMFSIFPFSIQNLLFHFIFFLLECVTCKKIYLIADCICIFPTLHGK